MCVLGLDFGESLERSYDNLIVFVPFLSSDKTSNYSEVKSMVFFWFSSPLRTP